LTRSPRWRRAGACLRARRHSCAGTSFTQPHRARRSRHGATPAPWTQPA
jgi:hypothetical protein